MRPHHLLLFVPLLVVVLGARPEKERQSSAPEQVSVTVAVRDLATGELVTEADITNVLVPREWVTSSLIQSDSRQYIIGQRVLLPVMKGDLLSWNLFETTADPTLRERCASATGQPETAAEQVSRARQTLVERPREDASPGH
ncbi:hypothetical protein JQX13_28475 [Archangium violaceum]|uniref:SAF domain-containing protein n=1 Tax=Archangium violaceum TaxID=83451 RepID=UPI00193BE6B4|nr:SAF domain-containing protein [Archangium violaceum]QRK04204.1 hypothetical protein JQX13_28475 [Archangium violaceum]